jgi:ABC-type sugar transport system ATPase subunit
MLQKGIALPMQNLNSAPQIAENWVLGTSPRMTFVRLMNQTIKLRHRRAIAAELPHCAD